MRKLKLWHWILFLISSFFGLILLLATLISTGVIEDDKPSEEIEVTNEVDKLKRVENKEYNSLSFDDKKELLEKLVTSKYDPYKSLRLALQLNVKSEIQSNLKFPNTLKFKSSFWTLEPYILKSNTFIHDLDKGELVTKGVYRSENSLSQKVQNNYSVYFTFDGKDCVITNVLFE